MSNVASNKENWTITQLDNLFEFVIGGDWGEEPDSNLGDNYVEVACIRGSEIKNWNKEKGKSASIRKIKRSSFEKRALRVGDILVEISGGGPDQPVGRTVYIDKEALSIRPEYPKICSNFLRLIRLVDSVDKKYVEYYLRKFYISGEVVNYQGGSNNLRNLKFKEYSKINLPIASLNEQRRISKKLDEAFHYFESLSSRLSNIPALIKAFKEKVLTLAFKGKLTEEWRFENKISYDWGKVAIGDLITSIEAGKNFKCPDIPVTSDTVGLVKISAVTWGKFDVNETKTVYDSKLIIPNLFIETGDFLFSRANTLELVGASLIVEDIRYKVMLSDKIWRVHFKEQITKHYLNYYLKSRAGRDEIESRASGNQLSMRNISQEKFKNIPVPLPSLAEQNEIVIKVSSFFNIADAIEEQYKTVLIKIKELPGSILTKAFSGELG